MEADLGQIFLGLWSGLSLTLLQNCPNLAMTIPPKMIHVQLSLLTSTVVIHFFLPWCLFLLATTVSWFPPKENLCDNFQSGEVINALKVHTNWKPDCIISQV